MTNNQASSATNLTAARKLLSTLGPVDYDVDSPVDPATLHPVCALAESWTIWDSNNHADMGALARFATSATVMPAWTDGGKPAAFAVCATPRGVRFALGTWPNMSELQEAELFNLLADLTPPAVFLHKQ